MRALVVEKGEEEARRMEERANLPKMMGGEEKRGKRKVL